MDPLRKVVPGDSPAALLSADRFNILSDVGRWWRNRANGPQGAGTDEPLEAVPRLEVWVRSTSTLPIYAVVKPTAAIIDPVAAPANALSWPAFDVSAPASEDDLVAITTMPHPGGTEIVRRAVIQGVAVVEVEMEDESHQFARPIPGSIFRLKSAETGSIRLLPDAADSGSGSGSGLASTRNRLVLMGGSASSGGTSSSTCGPGIGWMTGIRPTTCLHATVISASGDCSCNGTNLDSNTSLLYDEAQEYWISGEDNTLDLCFFSMRPIFRRGVNGQLPTLQLQDHNTLSGIGTIDGVLECAGEEADGTPYAIFAFGDARLCTGGDGSGSGSGGGSTQCHNVVRIKVKCGCPTAGIAIYCCPNPVSSILYLTIEDTTTGITRTLASDPYGGLGTFSGWCWTEGTPGSRTYYSLVCFDPDQPPPFPTHTIGDFMLGIFGEAEFGTQDCDWSVVNDVGGGNPSVNCSPFLATLVSGTLVYTITETPP